MLEAKSEKAVRDEETTVLNFSVIIPAHNRPHSLSRLLGSIGHADQMREIIVVDDGSDPPLRVLDDRVQLIRNDNPHLVSWARNRGATRASGDILIFVDDDCLISTDALLALGKVFEKQPNLGLAGPVIAYLESPKIIWCAGVERSPWTGLTHFRCRGRDVNEAVRIDETCEDFPSVFAIRRALFEEIGGFDVHRFPMHMEEADLGDRVRERGYEVKLVPEATAFHDLSPRASLARRVHIPAGERAHIVARDRVRYILERHSPRRKRFAALMFWMIVLVPAYLVVILGERGRPTGERLKTARAFVWGNLEGVREHAGHSDK